MFTSVAGHLLELEFEPRVKGWHSCAPRDLYDASVHKGVPKVGERCSVANWARDPPGMPCLNERIRCLICTRAVGGGNVGRAAFETAAAAGHSRPPSCSRANRTLAVARFCFHMQSQLTCILPLSLILADRARTRRSGATCSSWRAPASGWCSGWIVTERARILPLKSSRRVLAQGHCWVLVGWNDLVAEQTAQECVAQ